MAHQAKSSSHDGLFALLESGGSGLRLIDAKRICNRISKTSRSRRSSLRESDAGAAKLFSVGVVGGLSNREVRYY